MWFKVVLLLIYLCVLFILARLIEALVWHEQGQLSHRLLDPMALSVLKLKALLEQRGVNYNSLVEKSELSELVEVSGAVTEEDQEAALMLQVDDSKTLITNFSGGTDFYEQVEDAKDSMWLVEVVSNSHQQHLLSDAIWRAVRRKVDKFGVRLGHFDCSKDTRYCMNKKWFSSRLVLALPGSYQSKANVTLYMYPGSIRTDSIFDWIRQKLDLKIHSIESYDAFQTDWLTYKSALNPEVRAIFFSSMATIPVFFSALSVKFPGRVKVGYVNTKTQEGKYLIQKANIGDSTSTYLIITAEKTFYYGYNSGEILNFHCLEFYLKTLYPSLNDMFILSLMVTNTLGFFEISLTPGRLTTKIIRLFVCIFKYNVMLILCWISLLGIYQLPLVETFVLWGIRAMRFITGTFIFSVIRKDIIWYSIHWPLLLISYFVFLTVTSFICKKMGYMQPSDAEHEDSDWWNFSSLRTAEYGEIWWGVSSLRPFDSIFNPTMGVFYPQAGSSLDLEEPLIPNGYIKQLKTWKYSPSLPNEGDDQGHCSSSDDRSEESNNQPKSFPDYGQCVICLEPFVAEDKLLGLPCFHSFHENCILAWLTLDKHFCPVCRWPSYKPKCHNLHDFHME
ncbi:hypothetical protein CHS0354_007221 [Potamilus streckersoni]|uniref:RING-type domain-containing protein n=1 Tax=Potamilus streckersoni TaxID=2493646 RepID=A0AAE0VM67_9BIVA|nr:hypothetical protein CHS0354_007221 [Potamilus streckersoni]